MRLCKITSEVEVMRNSFSAMISEGIFVSWVGMSSKTERHTLSFLRVHFFWIPVIALQHVFIELFSANGMGYIGC